MVFVMMAMPNVFCCVVCVSCFVSHFRVCIFVGDGLCRSTKPIDHGPRSEWDPNSDKVATR